MHNSPKTRHNLHTCKLQPLLLTTAVPRLQLNVKSEKNTYLAPPLCHKSLQGFRTFLSCLLVYTNHLAPAALTSYLQGSEGMSLMVQVHMVSWRLTATYTLIDWWCFIFTEYVATSTQINQYAFSCFSIPVVSLVNSKRKDVCQWEGQCCQC